MFFKIARLRGQASLHLALRCIPPLALSGCGTDVPDLLNIYDARAEVPAV